MHFYNIKSMLTIRLILIVLGIRNSPCAASASSESYFPLFDVTQTGNVVHNTSRPKEFGLVEALNNNLLLLHMTPACTDLTGHVYHARVETIDQLCSQKGNERNNFFHALVPALPSADTFYSSHHDTDSWNHATHSWPHATSYYRFWWRLSGGQEVSPAIWANESTPLSDEQFHQASVATKSISYLQATAFISAEALELIRKGSPSNEIIKCTKTACFKRAKEQAP